MDIQAYSYTVLSSIIGMGIVFTFLGFLSVLMVVIKKLFDNPQKAVITQDPGKKSGAGETKSASAESSAEDSSWIIAAVAAFLEDEDQPRSALSWLPQSGEKQDQWVSSPRIHKQQARVF